MSVNVRPAAVADIDVVRTLFREYVTAPHSEALFHAYLEQQDFERELATLPGDYSPPLGAVLLAEHGDIVIGCVALKPIAPPDACEMKRLYVRPEGRGLRAGHALVEHIIAAGSEAGYRVMRLDCMPSMHAAQQLYRSFGFYEIPAYNENPVAGSLFFELRLSQ